MSRFYRGVAWYKGGVPARGLKLPPDTLLENWIDLLNLSAHLQANQYDADSLTDTTISKQFRSISRSCHPDSTVNKSQALKDAAAKKFHLISRAAELLKSFENDKFLQQQLDNAVKNVRRVVLNRYKFWMEKGKPTFRLRSWADDMSQSPLPSRSSSRSSSSSPSKTSDNGNFQRSGCDEEDDDDDDDDEEESRRGRAAQQHSFSSAPSAPAPTPTPIATNESLSSPVTPQFTSTFTTQLDRWANCAWPKRQTLRRQTGARGMG